MNVISKAFILEQLHRAYREDAWLNEIVNAGAVDLDHLAQQILDIYNSNWFDTLPETYVDRYEDALGIPKDPTKPLAERRSTIEAKWKSYTKVTLQILQSVVDSVGGGCTVTFEYDPDLSAQVIRVSGDGFYPKSEQRVHALEEVKPAHLAVTFDAVLKSERCEAHHGGLLREVWADAPTL